MSTEVDSQEYWDSFVDISEKKDRGILKRVIKQSTSDITPCPGDTVVVHYVGTYVGGEQAGEKFDSSRDRNSLFEFIIGRGDVINAWDVGVATMHLGEICELVAAPEYAYKDGKSMKFEIELFDSKGDDVSEIKDGSVRKSILQKGEASDTPLVGLEADVSYKLLGTQDPHTEVQYIVGDFTAHCVPETVDLAVRQMTLNETCRVRFQLSSNNAKEIAGDDVPTERMYEVHLKSFEKLKPLFTIPKLTDQMDYANTVKEKANSYMKKGKYILAFSLYESVALDLATISACGPEQKILYETVTSFQLNLALASVKLGNFEDVNKYCKFVLDRDASNEKAKYRLGQACLLRKDHEAALVHFKSIVARNPNNTAAIAHINACEEALKVAKEKEKKLFRGIYERFKMTGLDNQEETNGTLNSETSVA